MARRPRPQSQPQPLRRRYDEAVERDEPAIGPPPRREQPEQPQRREERREEKNE